MGLIFGVIVMIVMGVLADSKGFSPWCWILAGGIPGFLILLFLPSGKAKGIDEETARKRIESGNSIGIIISIIAVVLILLTLIVITQ
jgi:hypothetical protein